MKIIELTDEQYNLTLESLKAFKEYMAMINKLPIKKADKLKGVKFQQIVGDLINYYENEVN